MKKLITFILTITAVVALYGVWVKLHVSCMSCTSTTTFWLPFTQFTLAILALIGVILISVIYYISHKICRLKHICLGVSGVYATIASFLMVFQIRHIICLSCLITDIMFCIIFFLICLENSCEAK